MTALPQYALDRCIHIFWKNGVHTADMAGALGLPESVIANRLAAIRDADFAEKQEIKSA